MRKAFLGCCLLLLANAAFAGQEAAPDTTLPSVERILEKYIEAAGGRDALEKVGSRIIKGTFDLPEMGSAGTWERYEKAPDKAVTIIDIPGFGIIRQAFDGTVAWEDNPMAGLMEKSGTALARARLDSQFHRELRLRDLYEMSVKGKEKVGEREAWLVEAVPAEGGPEKLFFDTETGLLICVEAEREGPQGPAMIRTTFEEYKDVEGTRMPFTMKQSGPGFGMTLKVTEARLNAEVDDARFAKPVPVEVKPPPPTPPSPPPPPQQP